MDFGRLFRPLKDFCRRKQKTLRFCQCFSVCVRSGLRPPCSLCRCTRKWNISRRSGETWVYNGRLYSHWLFVIPDGHWCFSEGSKDPAFYTARFSLRFTFTPRVSACSASYESSEVSWYRRSGHLQVGMGKELSGWMC